MVGFETCGPNEAIVVSGKILYICLNFALSFEMKFPAIELKAAIFTTVWHPYAEYFTYFNVFCPVFQH